MIRFIILTLFFYAVDCSVRKDPSPLVISPEDYAPTNVKIDNNISVVSFSNENRFMYLGGENAFYVIDLANPHISTSAVWRYNWTVSEANIKNNNRCLLHQDLEERDCENVIRLITYDEYKNQLLVCGTVR